MLEKYNIDTFYNFIFNSMVDEANLLTVTKQVYETSFLGSHLLESSIINACDKIMSLLDKKIFEEELEFHKKKLLNEINKIENIVIVSLNYDYSLVLNINMLEDEYHTKGEILIRAEEIKFSLSNDDFKLIYDEKNQKIEIKNNDSELYKKIINYKDNNILSKYKVEKRETFESFEKGEVKEEIAIDKMEYIENLKNEFFYSLKTNLKNENLNYNVKNILDNINNLQKIVKLANDKKYKLKNIFDSDIFKNLLLNTQITRNLNSSFEEAMDLLFLTEDLNIEENKNNHQNTSIKNLLNIIKSRKI